MSSRIFPDDGVGFGFGCGGSLFTRIVGIAVYLTQEDKLGFITRFKNETIARLMDAGRKFIAVVDDPESDEESRRIMEDEKSATAMRLQKTWVFPSLYICWRTADAGPDPNDFDF